MNTLAPMKCFLSWQIRYPLLLDLASLDSTPKPALEMALLRTFGRSPTCFPNPDQACDLGSRF